MDARAELVQRRPTMRQFSPALLEAFAFEGAASAARSRSPLSLETSVPGIFAIGDVRAGSTKRVAATVAQLHTILGAVLPPVP